ncbi:MAG: ClC family H(+)/Cl(-) exchange transporter [Desulfovibrionaceae bacterium]|nr:ClC family H(+)/Cl(-) exchange transporter [Desulfovibrionaceae bacterium]
MSKTKPTFRPHTQVPPLWQELVWLGQQGVLGLCVEGILTGLVAGSVIAIFRLAYTKIGQILVDLAGSYSQESFTFLVGLVGYLLFSLIISFLLLRFEPLISGSGIPQVELQVAGLIGPMRWLKVLLAKFLGTLVSLSAGLSVGREGPCIQMGAAAALGLGSFFRAKSGPSLARFLIAGAVAGMTAAFGAPIAGLLFAFEEMRTVLVPSLFLFCAFSAAAAWFVVQVVFDFGLVFPLEKIVALDFEQWWLVLFFGLATGLLSAFYNQLLVGTTLFADGLRVPKLLRVSVPFILAAILFYFYPYVLTNFGLPILALEEQYLPFLALLLFLLAKMLFSAISFASTVAGGLLMPMLAIGAIFGATVSRLVLDWELLCVEQSGVCLILGMVGLFAGTVRAPLTGTFLVLEMTHAISSLPAMIVTAGLAVFFCNLLRSEPVYESLKRRILRLQDKVAS